MRKWTLEECRVDELTARIPLCDRNRDIVAWSLVDVGDWGDVSRRRWQLVNGYAKNSVYLHRVLMDAPDGIEVDHINRDRLDNRRVNLRLGTRAQNAQNLPGVVTGLSIHRGVTYDRERGKWLAQVWLDGRNHYVGRFGDEVSAAAAASSYRRANMPFATS